MRTRLTEDDVKGVLARAEEIHSRSVEGHDSESILHAATEAGLPREAVEQALRERFDLFGEPPKVDDVVFARSSDDRHYVATVLGVTESGARVRFVKGGEATLPYSSLRPCPFLPGEELTVDWPWWGWWPVSVVSYDRDSQSVQVTDGWTEEWFSFDKIRLDPPKKHSAARRALFWTYAALGSVGAVVGAVATWLVMR
jgi:hypothetical protein